VLDQALFAARTPNLQLDGGFTVRFQNIAPCSTSISATCGPSSMGSTSAAFAWGSARYRF